VQRSTGDAKHRPVTLLRRAGTHQQNGPGSAAHRHSASKTRVNALVALRSVPGARRTRTFILSSRLKFGQNRPSRAGPDEVLGLELPFQETGTRGAFYDRQTRQMTAKRPKNANAPQ
jgi:hypothetical protein